MVAGYYRDGVLVANAVNTVKPTLNAVWGVANGAFDLPQFAKEAGAAGEGFFDSNYHLDGKNPQTQALIKTYKDKYNDDIRTGAVLAYDAVRVIADSLNRAKSADPTTLRGAIAQTNLPSLVAQKGPITFSSTGENQGAFPILMQVQGGKIVQTYPKDFAETAYRYPATDGASEPGSSARRGWSRPARRRRRAGTRRRPPVDPRAPSAVGVVVLARSCWPTSARAAPRSSPRPSSPASSSAVSTGWSRWA